MPDRGGDRVFRQGETMRKLVVLLGVLAGLLLAVTPLSSARSDAPSAATPVTFGNHNFDKGIAHLQSMIDLADFPYVSANLRNRDANLTGVEDFALFEVGGVTVGVVGVTNPEAPTLVFPGSFRTMEVTDPVPARRGHRHRDGRLRARQQHRAPA